MRFILIGLLFVGAGAALSAAPIAVDVVSVRFSDRRLAGQSTPWLEAAINLRAVKKDVEDVNVSLWLKFGNETRGRNSRNTSSITYTGRVKLYALDKTAIVRFYLPPDVVRMRRLGQTPEAWMVSVSSSYGAETLPRTSPNLTKEVTAEAINTAAGGAMELLPHYSTPFYSLSETQRDLPSYVVP